MSRITYFNNLMVTTVLLLFACPTVWAQESRAARFERIEAEKIAFITKSLDLSPAEAEKFFPIYNQYRAEFARLRQEKQSGRSNNPRTDLQSQSLRPNSFNPSRDVLAFDAKELELKKNYRKRFTDVVGAARASQFFEVEEEFRNYLMRELQQRRRGRNP